MNDSVRHTAVKIVDEMEHLDRIYIGGISMAFLDDEQFVGFDS